MGVGCPKPDCKGKVVIRRSRRGRVFYGCDEYPNCDFVAWNRPIDQPCPECSSPYLLEKVTKRYGTQHVCPAEECEYTEHVEV